MRRLATQIHATVVAVLVLFAVLLGVVWWHGPGVREAERLSEGAAETAGEVLPGPERPVAELQDALERLAPAIRAGRGGLLGAGRAAGVGRGAAPASRGERATPALDPHSRAGGARVAPAGRAAAGGLASPPPTGATSGASRATVALLALAVGIGAWPLVHRLTQRLERLRLRVDDLGRGDLGARAPVEGRDEVADLARSFNRAADRIQQLVEAERRRLAFASHELRSPLARLRVSLEMMAGDPAVKGQAERDVAELDGLIGELLEASRLEALGRTDRDEAVDLLGLAAEEAARLEATVGGQAVEVRGDPRLLRRLVRNLLENARRHGGTVEAHVARLERGVRLTVADRGPGVVPAERERIFGPFYRPPGASETGASYGLGLALVRQIARAHGGEARCLPREGGRHRARGRPRRLTRDGSPASNPPSTSRRRANGSSGSRRSSLLPPSPARTRGDAAAVRGGARMGPAWPCSSCPGWWP